VPVSVDTTHKELAQLQDRMQQIVAAMTAWQ
jgi:hypothetical protein